MNKIYIWHDEFYPFYGFYKESQYNIVERDISDDKLKWVEETMGEFYKVQEYLRHLETGLPIEE